jgi:lipoprotein-releasing system permease protein
MNLSSLPFELRLGWRYTRAGRAARRNRFISFISSVSMLGIALGVAALIIVLSVMNGFQKEVRDRMLGVLSHIEVLAYTSAALDNPAGLQNKIGLNPQVIASAPFVMSQVLLAQGEDMRGALVRGIDPMQEGLVTDAVAVMAPEVSAKLQPGELWRDFGWRVGQSLGREGGRAHHLGGAQWAGDTCRCGAALEATHRGRFVGLGSL